MSLAPPAPAGEVMFFGRLCL